MWGRLRRMVRWRGSSVEIFLFAAHEGCKFFGRFARRAAVGLPSSSLSDHGVVIVVRK